MSNAETDLDKGRTKSLQDYIAANFISGGYTSYAALNEGDKQAVRVVFNDFLMLAKNPENTYQKLIKNDDLNPYETRMLDLLLADETRAMSLIQKYTSTVDIPQFGFDNDQSALKGYRLQYILEEYKQYKATRASTPPNVDPYDLITDEINAKIAQMGEGFTGYFDYLDTDKKIRNIFLRNNGKFREDTGPALTKPYQCRIGGSTFFVPPTSISVHQGFTAGSLSGGTLRQQNSSKTNLGHSETSITVSLYFPNHETIWGFKGDTARDIDFFNWDPNPIIRKDLSGPAGDKYQTVRSLVPDYVIDSYLSSLRGLITQFKYSPILPIKNEFLNRTFDIDAVALMGMTVSTVPDFPFVVSVNLELAKYNYAPLMPMIQDFDQAIHWGKFRQYMGRAATRLESRVSQGFLVEKVKTTTMEGPIPNVSGGVGIENDPIARFSKVDDIADGRNFRFYYPISDPSRIFAPDTTDFRQPGEDLVITKDIWDGVLSLIGLDIINSPSFSLVDYDRAYRYSKYRNQAKVLQQWLNANKIAWNSMNPQKMQEFIDKQITDGLRDGTITTSSETAIRAMLKEEWFFAIYGSLLQDDSSLNEIKNSRTNYANYTIKEWKVPMDQMMVDWSHCIVNGVAVSLSNNFARLQVQLQDEPTYQHIGGGDSTVQVDMTVIGEENLIKFRRLFEHVNGLARIEKAHGVLGFLGVKNILTALCGVKYVLPLDFETETVPNFPHVYKVRLSFIDFDVMQGERERLSSDQQREMVELAGKRNPFLRLKQIWGAFNGYPDFPLEIIDEDGKLVGHLDPDWYFRAFKTSNDDTDIFKWGFDSDAMNYIQEIAKIQAQLSADDGSLDVPIRNMLTNQMTNLEAKLKDLIDAGGKIPSYWQLADGHLSRGGNNMDPNYKGDNAMPEPEYTIYLGSYNDNNKEEATILSFFEGGFFALGTKNTRTNEVEYSTGISYLNEDLASSNLKDIKSDSSLSGLSDYQREYLDKAKNPNQQYEAIMQDYSYRNIRGRMLRAFPTYMLWLIDEGGKFAGIKLFDNFYGLNSVIDFSVSQSEKPLEDTLVLRLSNIYQKLTTPYREQIITEDDPLYETAVGQWISTMENRQRNIESGLKDTIFEINNIRLKPGVRIHLRAGYSANPNALQTIFNGVITEVEPGDIMTIIAQSDAVEFSGLVNTNDPKGSSGKLDGGLSNLWMSEPRDLIVRLLTMGSSKFKEWVSWGSKGVLFSDSRFGIRHFGSMLYEPMSSNEGQDTATVLGKVGEAMQSTADTTGFTGLIGPTISASVDIAKILSNAAVGTNLNLNSTMMQIGQLLWINSFAKRDYEIFKRNIYPGNGTGIAQFMGGDQIDAGITITSAITYYNDANGQKVAKLNTVDTQTGDITLTKEQQNSIKVDTEANREDIADIWQVLVAGGQETDSEILDLLHDANLNSQKLFVDTSNEFGNSGIIDGLLSPIKMGLNALNSFDNFTSHLIHEIPLVGNIPGIDLLFKAILPIPGYGKIGLGLSLGKKLVGGIGRLASPGNPIGHLLGLAAYASDDDIQGFDEVSFRASTYMKSVWDMFELCAALLPNYIIAVRPFEDRSTLFYGKPHWLYTSGVIPVTTGIPKNPNLRPLIDKADAVAQSLLADTRREMDKSAAQITKTIDKAKGLRDILNFTDTGQFDPYHIIGDTDLGVYLTSQEEIAAELQRLDALIQSGQDKNGILERFYKVLGESELGVLPYEQVKQLVDVAPLLVFQASTDLGTRAPVVLDVDYAEIALKTASDKKNTDEATIRAFVEAVIASYAERVDQADKTITTGLEALQKSWEKAGMQGYTSSSSAPNLFTGTVDKPENTVEAYMETLSASDRSAFTDLLNRDPITFAFQFGWKFSTIPIWIDPETGYGVDKIGELTRKAFDENYSGTVDSMNSNRSLHEASDIWETLRNKAEGISEKANDIYIQYFPMQEMLAKFDDTWDLFIRFLWQDPYNRAWVIAVVDKVGDGLGDTLNPLGDNSNHWGWDKVISAFERFLVGTDVEIDPDSGLVTSKSTKQWMTANAKAGKDAHNFVSGTIEDITDWFDKNIGQVLGLIANTITGFISSIRMSLTQVGNALSMSGTYQKQANILNASLNDSIYYKLGTNQDDILRLVDNPFTREYGEPVIEIREPFQRIHYTSSFDNILSNGIKENLQGVATVITATTSGKHPVTVHFDKGVSPERQVEKTVETGLLWDNAVGNGFFGFLQPLMHPIESLRAVAKISTGSSDELSARRVALYHLRESLKQIYQGELLIIGDPDIRPFDLVYIADVYERMYGVVEAQRVIHHFTPETGFVTAITPNPLISVNDPVRYSLLSYAWAKMSNYNLRDDMRAYLGITTDRAIAHATESITTDDIYKNMSTQIHGSWQYTHGNTAVIRDLGAVFAAEGIKGLSARDEAMNQAAKLDIGLALATAGLTVGGAAIGTLIEPGGGTIVGATAGWAVGDLIWKGWEWVKENLIDQHGLYIQYLNKDGQPMDAGLGYYQGVAVGTNHTIKLLPSVMGVGSGMVNVMENGHFRITTNDLLGALGWSEVETVSLYRDTSWFVNQVNANILKIAGRDVQDVANENYIVATGIIIGSEGETIDGQQWIGVEDGDTLNVKIVDGGGFFSAGNVVKVRMNIVNTYELQYHDKPYTSIDETDFIPDNDLGKMALQYLRNKFANPENRKVAIRFDKRHLKSFDRYVGLVFNNVPLGTESGQALNILKGYASQYPPISFDQYLPDGRPYTVNWEMVMTGYGNVEMKDSIWNNNWRNDATNQLPENGGN